MILLYGEARGNASRALALYRDRFPNRRHPNRQQKFSEINGLDALAHIDGPLDQQQHYQAVRYLRTAEWQTY